MYTEVYNYLKEIHEEYGMSSFIHVPSSCLFNMLCFLFPIGDQGFLCFSDLLNVFEVFLPQLLLYPNASDPLNGDAASLMMKDKKLYDQKVKGEHIVCYGLHFFLII